MDVNRFAVAEGSSAKYTATLKDETGVVVPGSSLTALTLTLYDVKSKAIINTRNNQDVKNANDVTIDEQGALAWNMRPPDNPVLNNTLEDEIHRAVFKATWGSNRACVHAVDIVVGNANKLT